MSFSRTGRTIYYNCRSFQSLDGMGFKANYIESGEHYWISGCRKDGNDTLYGGVVEIDDNVREEDWSDIRNMPENSQVSSFKSAGEI